MPQSHADKRVADIGKYTRALISTTHLSTENGDTLTKAIKKLTMLLSVLRRWFCRC